MDVDAVRARYNVAQGKVALRLNQCQGCAGGGVPPVWSGRDLQSFNRHIICIASKSFHANPLVQDNGTMLNDDKTDLIFYDYTANGCALPQQVFQLEPETVQSYAVQVGRTYMIGLDVDSTNCTQGGWYTLKTELL